MDQVNTGGFDFKPAPTNSYTHKCEIVLSSSLMAINIEIQKGLIGMCCLEFHMGIFIYVLLGQ
jgi:hypothetical protein